LFICFLFNLLQRLAQMAVTVFVFMATTGKGIGEAIELIFMQETDEGVSGYTTGLKYTKTPTIPGSGYKYVGYLCDNDSTSVTFNNGTFETTSSSQAICRAYFNRYSGNVIVNYFLEKSDGTYESVSSIPSLGYIYNKEKSRCKNNSNIVVDNNIVTIDASSEDECNIYFDAAFADVKVNVYIRNHETGKYDLGSVPTVGYDFYNAGCTNGAEVSYNNGSLHVEAEGHTVCTVYFK